MIGERVDVGDFGIADRDIDQVLVGMHVLRLAERHHHRRGVGGAGERDPLLRPRFAGRENERRGDQCRQRRCESAALHQRAGRLAPVRAAPCAGDVLIFVLALHFGLPAVWSSNT